MAEHNENADDYYCARRDSEGNIRLNCGRGLLVANADHTITNVREWLSRATDPKYKAQYESALALLLEEAEEAVRVP